MTHKIILLGKNNKHTSLEGYRHLYNIMYEMTLYKWQVHHMNTRIIFYCFTVSTKLYNIITGR